MLKWSLVVAGVLVLLVVGALAALPWFVDTPRVQAYVANAASQALGRPVRFSSLSISGFPLPTVRLRRLEVAEDPRFGSAPFLTVEEGSVRIRLIPLLSGRVELADVSLDRFRLDVVEDGGRLNLSTLGAPVAAGRPPARGGPGGAGGAAASGALVSTVRLTHGAVHYGRRGAKGSEFRLEDMDLTVRGGDRPDSIALEGRAVGHPGAVRVRLADGSVTLAAGRALTEAPLRASLEVDAQDIGALSRAVLASPTLGGPLKGKLELSGTASALAATGELSLERLTVSASHPECRPPRRQLALSQVRVPLRLTPARLDSAPLQAQIGGGALSLRASVAWQAAPALVTLKDIRIQGVALGPILVDYLCQAYAVTGPLELSGDAALRAGDLWRTLSGSGRLRIGPGQVVGTEAVGFLRDVTRVAGLLAPVLDPGRRRPSLGSALDFDSITATYTITGGVVQTEDLVYRSPAVTAAAAGTYALPDARIDMALTLGQGRTQIKARVVGTTTPRALRVVPEGIQRGEPGGVRKLLERLLR